MASNFPTSLDSFTDPTATNSLASPDHASQHTNINDIVAAIEAKVGINSSAVTTSIDYLLNHGGTVHYRLSYSGTSAPGSPTDGDQWYDTTNKIENLYSGADSAWITVTPVTLGNAHSGTTSVTTFTAALTSDSGTNPSVALLTGTQALVTVTASIANGTASDGAIMTWAVSGATTTAASTTYATNGMGLTLTNAGTIGTTAEQMSATYKVTGLTAGVNTFQSQYASITGGTSTFKDRSITVVAVPAGG